MTSLALKKFNDIYEDTFNDVRKYVILKCKNITDVEDILQNIYTDVFKSIKKGNLVDKSYVMGITKHKVMDYYRFKFKLNIIDYFKNEEKNFDIQSDFDLEESVLIKVDASKVWDYLKHKNVIISKVFYLYYYEGLSLKEISNTLSISETCVKHYLYRTLNELKKYMKEEK